MTGQGSSSDQQFQADDTRYQGDVSLAAEERSGLDRSKYAFSADMAFEDEQPLSQLERIASQLVNSQSGEQIPSTVPLLGYLVPGAEYCAILTSDPVKRRFSPRVVANLSREFIYALAGEDGKHLLNAAKEAKPYLIINLPDSKLFEAINELSLKDGIRTLWLVPWCEPGGSVFGAFLFASKKAFSPSREAIVSVTLLTAWMTAILRQARDRKTDGRFKAGFDNSQKLKTGIEDDPRIAAMDHLIKDLNRSRQNRITDKNGNQLPYLFTGGADSSTVMLRMYEDKDGLPVTYDAATHEQRKKAKSDAISVLWHELLSPLTVIKGYTSTLLQLSKDITEEQKEQYIKGIDSASDRVIRLLENLRDITRLEETDSITTQPIHLLDLVRSMVSEMQAQTTNHIIKLRPSERLPRVRIDPEKIEQVINNLLANAVKYSPQGGDIEVEIRMIRTEQELRRMFGDTPQVRLPGIVVSVADAGIGIPEEELSQIFEQFYRVNNKMTRSTPGAGLGLYICKIIVEAHGGHIWARNRLQGGSVFSFSLPLD